MDESYFKVNKRYQELMTRVQKVSLRFKEFDLKSKFAKREKQLAEGAIWNNKVRTRIEKISKKLNEKSDLRLSEENETKIKELQQRVKVLKSDYLKLSLEHQGLH